MNVAVVVGGSFDALLARLLHHRRRFASRTLVVEIAVAALLPDTSVEVVRVKAPDLNSDQGVVAAVAVFVLDVVVVAAADTFESVHSLAACADMQNTEEHIHIASVEAAVLADEDDLEAPGSSLCDERAFRLLM